MVEQDKITRYLQLQLEKAPLTLTEMINHVDHLVTIHRQALQDERFQGVAFREMMSRRTLVLEEVANGLQRARSATESAA